MRARFFAHIDWFLFAAAFAISLLGLVTMRSFSSENVFFERQIAWIAISVGVFLLASIPEYRFLRRTPVVVALYLGVVFLLALVLGFAAVVKGATTRFDLGIFAVQPAEIAKLVLIIVLAKYFARRHIEIAHIRHILVSGAYALFLCGLIFFQPDLGSMIIVACIWIGMVLVAGISWRHLATLAVIGLVCGAGLWAYALHDYQKQRILTFLHPLSDIRGSGYNAYQSTVAVGSGQLLGKGIGYGTQSKLQFLPEYQTDFIFAAYAEEWGFVGVLLLFGLYIIIVTRVLLLAARGGDTFDTLFGVGVVVMISAHFLVHMGMNMGLVPVTGTTAPFMSYGGSHLVVEFAMLGMLMGMSRHARSAAIRPETAEFVGPV